MPNERYLRWEGGRVRPPRGRNRSLLWPVHVWTVMAPAVGSSELNVFQEAILGLLNTGMRDRTEIAGTLSLDSDLVAFIIATQLQPHQWLDHQHQVTPLGKQVLEGSGGAEPDMVVQYAFQDAVSGQWLPRFAASLPEISPVPSRQIKPEFVVDLDTGNKIRPIVLEAVERDPRPDKPAAKQALTQFLRDMRRARLDEAGLVADAIGDNFEFVVDQPVSAYVWCEVFRSDRDLHPWLVSDPWRLMPAAGWLREPLTKHLPKRPDIAKRIAELLPEFADAAVTVYEYLKQLEDSVDVELSTLPHLDGHPLLREHFGRLIWQLRRIESEGRFHPADLASLAQESMSALEALLKWILETWPANAASWPQRDRVGADHFRAEPVGHLVNERAANVLGGLMARDVRLAALYRDRPLKALLAAALLSIFERSDHPLVHLPASSLQVDQLLSYVDMRNKAAHASGSTIEVDSVLTMARFALQWQEQFKPYF